MSEERDRASEDQNEATQRMAADEAVTRPPATPLDATRAMPPVDEATQQVWAARAAVPEPRVEPVADPAAEQWPGAYGEERAGRNWLWPAVIALVVLILFGMLAIGVWLILNRAGSRSAPTPGATATASPTPSGTPSPTAARTAPATTAAAQVPVPDVVGLSEAAARQQLAANGLSVTVLRRAVTGADPGTVTATEPGSGVMVARGSQVTLVVAAAPAPTTPAPTRPSLPTPRGSSSPSPART